METVEREVRPDEDAWELALFATEFPRSEEATSQVLPPRSTLHDTDGDPPPNVADYVWESHPAVTKTTAPKERTRSKHPPRRGLIRRLARRRILVWALVIVLIGAGSAAVTRTFIDLSGRLHSARTLLASSRTTAKASAGRTTDLTSQLARAQSLQRQQANLYLSQVSSLQDELDRARASKTKTVVQTKAVTKTVTKWVPDGSSVTVETTGFESMIEIHDVQITQAFGFSDLVGIAINSTGGTVSYAELGCSFLDAHGKVLANAIVNRTDWAAGASWGFDCSAQVTATGGVLRVDQMG
jgi:hypothetical protein